jgi:hypothetical protein
VVPPASEYVADGAANQAAWALAGGAEPPRWELAGTETLVAEPVPGVRERYRDRRDLTAEQAEEDNDADSPDTIAARWRAPPDPNAVGSSTERTGHA